MQICLLKVVTFIDLSAPCSLSSQLENFKELSKIYLGQILLRRSLLYHLTNALLSDELYGISQHSVMSPVLSKTLFGGKDFYNSQKMFHIPPQEI